MNRTVHLIPTDKPSRLCLSNNSILTIIEEANYTFSHIQSVHIYITSDEEIKVGDWVEDNHNIYQIKDKNHLLTVLNFGDAKKIILTTDQDLIKDGIQAIDDEFLEWFVKNPSCEEVEVGYGWIRLTETDNEGYWISIPDKQFEMQQEEPKQETLEEASERYAMDNFSVKAAVKFGAKWQSKRMYSEEEVKMLAFNFYYDMSHKMGVAENLISENRLNAEEWFKQFKKYKGGEQ